jgi:hypothetical protein
MYLCSARRAAARNRVLERGPKIVEHTLGTEVMLPGVLLIRVRALPAPDERGR